MVFPHRRGHEKINGKYDYRQRQHRDIGNAAHAPRFTPACQRKADAPVRESEADHDHHAVQDQSFIRVVQNVMAHLVAHGGFDFRQRAAFKQIVVQRNTHGIGEAADVGAHAI